MRNCAFGPGRQWSLLTQLRLLAARFARGLITFSLERGSGECRVRAAPAVSCAKCTSKCAHEHTGSAESIRHPPRNGFTAYGALSPATNSFLSPSLPARGQDDPVGSHPPPTA